MTAIFRQLASGELGAEAAGGFLLLKENMQWRLKVANAEMGLGGVGVKKAFLHDSMVSRRLLIAS